MSKKQQVQHENGYLEKDFIQGKIVATVQLRELSDGVSATWWVSGPGEMWMLHLLLELQMKLTSSDIKTALERCDDLAQNHIFPLAAMSGNSGGLLSLAPENAPELRKEMALKHINLHNQTEILTSGLDDSIKTVHLYLAAKGFGVKNPILFVADFFSTPTSTITRRLARARDNGLLTKQRPQIASKEIDSKKD